MGENCNKLAVNNNMFQFINFNMDGFFMKKCLLFFALFYSTVSIAGWTRLTHHSRANCANNESISWHFGESYTSLYVKSVHRDVTAQGFVHVKCGTSDDKGRCKYRENASREAAICWGEAPFPEFEIWDVEGLHSWSQEKTGDSGIIKTKANDCNTGEGW